MLAPAVATAIVGAGSVASAGAQTGRAWSACSKAAGNAAARQAGFLGAVDRDPILIEGFVGRIGQDTPSAAYRSPVTSLCGDFDADGHTDRALLYECCTVSSPAPWVILSRRGGRWQIVYRRLHDTTFTIAGAGTKLVTTEPEYADSDALCCPSRLRIGTLRWIGKAFKRTFRIVKSPSR